MQKPVKEFYVYILTNLNKTTLYTGVTNNLSARIIEHWDHRNQPRTFAGRYWCHYLIYYETFHSISKAIAREKEIKKWRREKKENLIKTKNPEWNFLNESICGQWPPTDIPRRLQSTNFERSEKSTYPTQAHVLPSEARKREDVQTHINNFERSEKSCCLIKF